MTLTEKKRLRKRFFQQLGRNADVFKSMFDVSNDLCMYMKDAQGRIMALNRRNCEICNFRDEWEAIGRTSRDLFAPALAESYMSLDREVLETGRPVLGRVTEFPADFSPRVMISDVHPLFDGKGRIIGTARAYRLSAPGTLENDRYGRLRKVAEYIDGHYAESLAVPDLARLCNMGITAFKREFRRVFSISPGNYVMSIRINAVRRLLESSDKLISDIAAECGFFDQSHLTRAFRKERGMTPGEYRRQHLGR